MPWKKGQSLSPEHKAKISKSRQEVTRAAPPAAMSEIGVTGLREYSGRVNEEFLAQLSGNRAWKVYREMRDNDPVVGSILFAIEMVIRQVPWHVEAASESAQDKEIAEFVESCRDDMNVAWSDIIAEILTMLPFGWAWLEVVYKIRGGDDADSMRRSKYNDGKIGWRKMPIRAQETLIKFKFDESGGVQGMYQQPPNQAGAKFIPITKSLLFRTTANKGNPMGRSVLRNAYRPWFFKKRIEESEGIGIERDLAGLPVAWVPPRLMAPNATAEDKVIFAAIRDIVTNIRRDEQEGVVMPMIMDESGNRLYDLQLMTSGGQRQFNTTEIITRYDQRIAMTVLADFILLGHTKIGTQALSVDKTELFQQAISAFVDGIADVFNRHEIPRLLALNGMRPEKMPQLKHADIDAPSLGELADYINKLSAAGMPFFPDENLENKLREHGKLPERPDDMEMPGADPDPEDDPEIGPDPEADQEDPNDKGTQNQR